MWHMAQPTSSQSTSYQRHSVTERLTLVNKVDVFVMGEYGVTDAPYNKRA